MKKKHKPKPNFLIIGAAKAGATSLACLLAAHPEAGIVLQGDFFSYDEKYKIGWVKYLRSFEGCLGKKAIGDASTSYSRIRYYPKTIERIHEHLRQPRIIYMVRHPLDRMVSAYVERMGYPNPPGFASINDAVRKEPMIIDSSRYWEVFDAYRRQFGESQIKIVWYEDYTANTTQVFQEVCRFLEINDTVTPTIWGEQANPLADAEQSSARETTSGVPLVTAWDEETRKWVMDQIQEDNLRLLQHFGKPLDYWNAPGKSGE